MLSNEHEMHAINLGPVTKNHREAMHGMRDYKIRRENKTVIIQIRIGDKTIIIRVPP